MGSCCSCLGPNFVSCNECNITVLESYPQTKCPNYSDVKQTAATICNPPKKDKYFFNKTSYSHIIIYFFLLMRSAPPAGTIKKGANSAYWVVTSNKWTEVGAKKPKTVNTVYNGENMKLVIGDSRIYAFHNNEYILSVKYTEYYRRGIVLFAATGVKNKYLYIDGRTIAEFKLRAGAPQFKSNLGNNWVPYAYVLADDQAYLMLEQVYFTPESRDPYAEYYKNKPLAHKFQYKVLYDAWERA